MIKIKQKETFWDWKTIVLSICGAAVTALGVAVIFGWHTHNLRLLQISPQFTPMVYMTALCFVLSGAGLAALTLGRARRVVQVAAGFVLSAGAAMLSEHIFHINLGIDHWIVPAYAVVASANPGRMAGPTSLCFTLTGICLLLLSSRQSRRRAVVTAGVLSAVIAGAGTVAFCGYLTDVTSFYAWGSLTRMAVHTALGFVVLGLGVCLYAWREESRRGAAPVWLPLLVGLGIVTATFCLYQALVVEQRQQVERLSRLEAVNVRNEIASQIQVRTDALLLLARRWNAEGELPNSEWDSIVSLYTEQHPGYQAVSWIDREGVVRRVFPAVGNESVIGFNVNKLPGRSALFQAARLSTDFSISPIRPLKQGGNGFLIDAPLRYRGNFDGFATGVFRMSEIAEAALSSDMTRGYSISIHDGDREVYFRSGAGVSAKPRDLPQVDMNYHGIAWRVTAWPNAGSLTHTEAWAPLIALWTGLALAFVCTIAVALGQAARRQSRELSMMNGALTLEISEGERTLEALRASEKRLSSVTETASEAIVVADRHGRLVSWNKGAQTVFGLTGAEAVGESLTVLMPERFRAMHLAGLERFLATGEARVIGSTVELTGLRRDGEEFPLELSLSSWTSGGEVFFTGIMRDVTERKQAEEALRQARDAALASTRAKSEFLANMSHEIRTPMNGVLGMTGLLLETSLNAEQIDYASTIRSSAESLLTIINDILDFSKIEAGKMVIEPAAIRLSDAVSEVVDLLSPRAAAGGLSLTYRIAPAARGGYWGDALRIRQVVTNFIGNAIKFTSQGGVSIDVDEVSGAQEFGVVRITVSDTGIGIPSDRLGAIFESFTQADGSTSRRYGGTGLGLAICRQLAELMGGRVGVDSVVGGGSRFWLELRMDRRDAGGIVPVSPAQAAKPSAEPLELWVLLAEDNPINQKLAVKLLEKWGCRVDAVTDGRAAVEAWSNGSYDVVLMDIQMPEMDGLQATRIIRGLEGRTLRRTPIIAMTANAMEGDRELCLESGMDDYLSKPIKPALLYETLRVLKTMDEEMAA